MSSWVLSGKSIVENSDKNLPLLLSPSAFFKTFNDCQKKALKHVALDNLRATENQDKPESVKKTAAFFDSVLRKTKCCIHNKLLAAENAKESEVKDKQMADLFVFFSGCNRTFTSKGK